VILVAVRRLQSGEVRALNIGYVSNLFYDLLPRTLASFRQLFPTVSVNLFDMSCGEQFRALEGGKLDLGFVGLHEPIALRGLEFRTIASYKTVAALPKDNPLAGKTTIALKALAPMFFIGMSEESYPYYREDGPGVQLVARGRDQAEVETAAAEIEALVRGLGAEPLRVRG